MNELHKKINQAKKELGLSNNGLATALGYSKPYITKVLNKLPGDKVQKRLIGEIEVLINNEKNRVAEVIGSFFGLVEVKPDLQPQNSAKSKVLNKEQLDCRASGSSVSVKSIDTGEIIKQKDRRIKQLISSEFGTACLLNIRKREISELNHKLLKERILAVIIFAVMLAIFLASHAI